MKRALLIFACSWLWQGHGFDVWGAERALHACVAIDTDLSRPPMRLTKDGGMQPLSLWAHQGKLWPQKATLRVRFLDGTKGQQDKAWKEFAKVDAIVNLSFVRVTSGVSEIRVSFRGSGHWSYVGTDCRGISQSKPTMNLQLGTFDAASEWQRVVVHEMIHAIGGEHEHQHPNARIPWNVPKVLEYYRRTQGWSESTTRRQVLNREVATDFIGSTFDRDSIMEYPVPKELVTDPRFAVGWNAKLSALDGSTLKRMYP